MYRAIRSMFAATALTLSVVPAWADNGGYGAYLAGRQAAFESDFEAAAQYFTRSLVTDPSNVGLMESSVLAQFSLGQIDIAAVISDNLQRQGSDSQIANMVLTGVALGKEDYDAAFARIEEQRAVGPLADGLIAAWAHLGQGNMSKAIQGFDRVSEERGLAGLAQYHKALALASVGAYEDANAVFEENKGGSSQSSRRSVLAHVMILSQLGRNPDAVELIDAVFGSDLDPALRQMRDALVAQKTLPFDMVTSAREGVAEVFYTIANALESEATPEYTLLYARLAQYLRPTSTENTLLVAALLDELGRFELASETYQQVPTDDPSFHAAELGRAEALRRSGKPDAAIEVLHQLARSHEDLAVVHASLGDILRRQKEYEGAIDAYTRAIELTPDEEANWFSLYARGIAHERLGHWPSAQADFREALRLRPGQPQVLNYLGYSLVEKGEKLDEALGMIERAAAARPTSGYIIDSLGWVLFRLDRYEEAVVHLERAAELEAVDPIVNDHLGDAYWMTGRKTEARFQWQRAMSFDPEEKDAQRIRRKLEVGLDQVRREETKTEAGSE